jgi:hypothetical protein
MLAQALGHPAYMVSAVAVVVVLITMDQRGARQMIVAGVAQPARAVVPIKTFNMPQDAHPVGRQALLDAIERRLCAGLSTNVYGMPGVGKSCLAAAVVSRLLGPDKRRGRRLFPGGVAWITCERLEAGEAGLAQLVASVSIALEIKLIGSGGPAEQLARALQARRRSLLVLHGLEVGEGGLREADVLRALRQNNCPRASAKSSDDEGEKTKIWRYRRFIRRSHN